MSAGQESGSALRERPLTPDDVPGVVDLFHRVYGRPISAEHYVWKLRTRRSPVENVALAVDADDRPIFHIAGIPCRARLGDEDRWVMVAVDGMTDPAWRRRGVLTRVTSDLFDRWRAAGVALVLGLPNDQWRSRISALGWKRMFPLAWLVRPILPQRVLARRTGIAALANAEWMGRWWNRLWDRPAARGIEVSDLDRAGLEWNAFWNGLQHRLGPCLARDADWINWRYLDAPGAGFRVLLAKRDGKPAGFLAFRVREGGGVIADVFTAPEDAPAFGALVGAAVRRLALDGVAVARTLAVPGSWPDRAYRRLGFFRGRHAFGVHGVILDPVVSEALEREGHRWQLSGGDFDVV